MSAKIEQLIADIDHILLAYMPERMYLPVIAKAREIAEVARYEGYSQGYDDKQAEVDEDSSL